MNEIFTRQINKKADTDTVNGTICVSQTRDSNGLVVITISIGSQSIKLTNEQPRQDLPFQFGSDYKNKARRLAEMITAIAADPCILPEQ